LLLAAAVTMSGGAGLGGRLGVLFGLHSEQARRSVSGVEVATPAAGTTVARGTLRQPARSAPTVRLRSRHPVQAVPPRTQAPSPPPTPAVPPGPAPVPPVQPPSPPKPSGNVERAVNTVRDTASPAVPSPAQPVSQPVLDQVAAAFGQACGAVGGCP
jgi:hypothetical protein